MQEIVIGAWTKDPKISEMIDIFLKAGLSGDTLSEKEYSLDGRLKINEKYIGFYAKIHRYRVPTADLSIFLNYDGTKAVPGYNPSYRKIKSEFNEWKSHSEEVLRQRIKRRLGNFPNYVHFNLNMEIYSNTLPSVTIMGSDASELIKEGKILAKKLMKTEYQPAQRY